MVVLFFRSNSERRMSDTAHTALPDRRRIARRRRSAVALAAEKFVALEPDAVAAKIEGRNFPLRNALKTINPAKESHFVRIVRSAALASRVPRSSRDRLRKPRDFATHGMRLAAENRIRCALGCHFHRRRTERCEVRQIT
jgi:hypothetical protein